MTSNDSLLAVVACLTDSENEGEPMPASGSGVTWVGETGAKVNSVDAKVAPKRKREGEQQKKQLTEKDVSGDFQDTVCGSSMSSTPLFHAMEVFAGSGQLSAALRAKGGAVDVIDLNRCESHDMSEPSTSTALLRKALLNHTAYSHFAPPCNTYSAAVWPPLRTW